MKQEFIQAAIESAEEAHKHYGGRVSVDALFVVFALSGRIRKNTKKETEPAALPPVPDELLAAIEQNSGEGFTASELHRLAFGGNGLVTNKQAKRVGQWMRSLGILPSASNGRLIFRI